MKAKLLLAVCFILVVGCGAVEAAYTTYKEANDAAAALMTKKDYSQAREAYAEAMGLAAGPDQKAEALMNIANAYSQENNAASARAEYDKVAAIEGVSAALLLKARMGSARTYETARDYDKAREAYQAIASAPGLDNSGRYGALMSVASTYMWQRQFDKSREGYRSLAAADWTTPDQKVAAVRAIGDGYVTWEGKRKEARVEYEKALKYENVSPLTMAPVYMALARSWVVDEKNEQARKVIADMMALNNLHKAHRAEGEKLLENLAAAEAVAVPGKYYEIAGTEKWVTRHPFLTVAPSEEPQQADFFLWLPDSVKKPAGLIVVSRHGSGEAFAKDQEVRKLAAELNMGVFSFIGLAVQCGVAPGSLEKALADLAGKSGHPELINAPMFLFGMSNGCGFSGAYACMAPERVFGWLTYHPGVGRFFTRDFSQRDKDNALSFNPENGWVNREPPPNYLIPGMVMLGEKDQFAGLARGSAENPDYNCLWEFEKMRREAGPLAHIVVEGGTGHGHRENASWTIVMEFIKASWKARVPVDADPAKGPVKLKEIKADEGWLGMNWDLKAGGWQELKTLSPAEYKGDRGKTSWLPSKEYALKWQEFCKNGTLAPPAK